MNRLHSQESFLVEIYTLSAFFPRYSIGLEQCAHVIDYCDSFIEKMNNDKTLNRNDKKLLIEFIECKKHIYRIAATVSQV
jgi:hypothetical protein